MQVFVYRDRGLTRELAQRARDAGYRALVLTIDNQLLGRRERDLANGFTIPPRCTARQWLAMAAKWRWGFAMRRELTTLTFGNYVGPGSTETLASLAGRMGSLLDPALNWSDVEALRGQWSGPLVLKGVLHPEEARQARALGVDALIVSNHGGRQLDGAAASLDALPAIVDAVGDAMPVLIDGGIRRGTDVLKAVALGARAVLIAPPQLFGLAVAGVARVAASAATRGDRGHGPGSPGFRLAPQPGLHAPPGNATTRATHRAGRSVNPGCAAPIRRRSRSGTTGTRSRRSTAACGARA